MPPSRSPPFPSPSFVVYARSRARQWTLIVSVRGLRALWPLGHCLQLVPGELTGTSHASAVDAGTTEHHSNTIVPNAAETGAAPAKDAKATKVSVRAYRRILRAPYPLPNPGNVRQSATAHREVSLVATGSRPDAEDSEREFASVGPPGFIPVVDFDGILPFSDSDEIETARGLPGSVRRRRKAGRRVRRQAVV